MTFNFVYITSNLINGRQYVGEFSTNKSSKIQKYLGSGLHLKNAIKKYGRENFKKEILEQFSTKEEAYNAQEKYIQQYNTLTPNGYNISPKGGGQCIGGISDETKKKISESKKGIKLSEEHKKKIGQGNIGRIVSIETRQKIADKNKISLKGKQLSNTHKNNIGCGNLGRIVSIETRQKIGVKNKISLKGKIVSEETKNKISNSLKGKNTLSKSDEMKEKNRQAHLGKKDSELTKKRKSEAQKNRYKNVKR